MKYRIATLKPSKNPLEIHKVFQDEPISPLDDTDEEYFYHRLSFVKTEALAFENNWPYIVQATRYRGYKYKKYDSIVYFYFKNPDYTSPVVVVHQLGIHSKELCLKLAELLNSVGLDILIKNVDIQDLKDWERLGFHETITPWSQCSLKDDNSYPEHVFDCKRIADAYLPRKANDGSIEPMKKGCGRRIRKYIRQREIICNNYVPNPTQEREIRSILEEDASYLQSKGTDLYQNVIDAHVFVFDQKITKNIYQLLHTENGVIQAHSYLTYVHDCLFYNSIINHKEPNLMLFILWQGIHHVYYSLPEPRPKYLSLQGSEVAGQNRWKKHMNPVQTINKTHISREAQEEKIIDYNERVG